MDEPNHWV